jgi:CBS-domain-containing membrane protein
MVLRRPDALARWAGHALVGVAVTYVAGKAFKAAAPAIVLAVLAMAAHAKLDAPVSQALSDLGL